MEKIPNVLYPVVTRFGFFFLQLGVQPMKPLIFYSPGGQKPPWHFIRLLVTFSYTDGLPVKAASLPLTPVSTCSPPRLRFITRSIDQPNQSRTSPDKVASRKGLLAGHRFFINPSQTGNGRNFQAPQRFLRFENKLKLSPTRLYRNEALY